MRVMVVEDAPMIRQRLVESIHELGGSVVAEEETEGGSISALRATMPDLMLLDMTLAKGSGFGVLLEAKRINPLTRIIVLTSFAQEQFRKKCLEAGADYFFNKTTDFVDFEKTLRLILGR
jgi:DNA-binding NarL/FixJ family response regulator